MINSMKKSLFTKGLLILALQLMCVTAFGQYKLSGKITDEKNVALPGATVVLKGTFSGTLSNKEGNYKFGNLKSGAYQLEVSFMGYQTLLKDVELIWTI